MLQQGYWLLDVLATVTRSDIAKDVKAVARYSHDSSEQHWYAVLKIIAYKYPNGAREMGILSSRS